MVDTSSDVQGAGMKQRDVRSWLEGLEVDLDQAGGNGLALIATGLTIGCHQYRECNALNVAAGISRGAEVDRDV
jgi:hypothetical protein